jgi:predicted ATPase/DNA-binding XRE family transcriptional regulator
MEQEQDVEQSSQRRWRVGEELRRHRELAGLSQEQLAERAGLSTKAIAALERGRRQRPHPHTIDLLAKALGLEGEERRALLAAALGSAVSVPLSVGAPPGTVRLLPSRVAPTHNLPLQLTSFVGREKELAEVRRLLQATRLLTVTGTGGSGKTRLALQLASDVLDRFPDGVWFVDLAPVSDPGMVPQAIATALTIPSQPGRPLLATVVETLRDLHLLVLLDNCEHVLDACARAADALLRACPLVRILATSREPLGIAGEVSWRLPSMPLPASDWQAGEGGQGLADLARLDAVRLFVERAQAADPSFDLTNRNAVAVARICRRLDGIPLALELAAARVRAIAVERIAERLDDQFRLLVGGSRVALPRQRTLRATVDWSHDLLSEPERVLFRRLAVFARGCTEEAIAGVCSGTDLDALDLPDFLARLVERSLVVVDRPREGRYRLLEPLRQYAQEKLGEAGEVEPLRDRHRVWYQNLAVLAQEQIGGPNQGAWLDRLEHDHDNLRAALEWCIGQGNARDGLEFAWGLTYFWRLYGYHEQTHSVCERLLALPGGGLLTRGRAMALSWRAWHAREAAARREAYQEAIDIMGNVGERRWAGYFGRFLAIQAVEAGDDERAEAIFQESLEVARDTKDRWLEGNALTRLSLLAMRWGNVARAVALAEQGLVCSRAVGDTNWEAWAHRNLGMFRLALGNVARARIDAERALAMFRELNVAYAIVSALALLAAVERRSGEPALARTLIEQAILAARDAHNLGASCVAWRYLAFHDWVTGELGAAARDLRQAPRSADVTAANASMTAMLPQEQVALGGLLLLGGEQEAEGVQFLGAAHRHGFRPTSRFPDEREKYESVVAEARRRLGEVAFAAAWARGQAMSLEEAIADSLQESTVGVDGPA